MEVHSYGFQPGSFQREIRDERERWLPLESHAWRRILVFDRPKTGKKIVIHYVDLVRAAARKTGSYIDYGNIP